MIKPFPKFKFTFQQLGVSLVSLGLGLGSGEYILWPFLTAVFGFNILWGALLGITIQVFLILEIQRYTSVRGEDFISGVFRLNKFLPVVLILCAVIGFGWPGFATSSSALLLDIIPGNAFFANILPYAILLVGALILTVGKDVYQKIEFIQTSIVVVSFVLISYMFISVFNWQIVLEMITGLLGLHPDRFAIFQSEYFSTFVGAVAYAGTGGVLILSQSFYSIDEKHGMTQHMPTIKDEKHLQQYDIEPATDKQSIQNFNHLRRFQKIENLLFFWGLGILTISMLVYIAYVFLHGNVDLPKGLEFLKLEAQLMGVQFGSVFSVIFLLIGFFALVSVQLGIYDITARIFVYAFVKLKKGIKTSLLYNLGVYIQLAIGVVILLLGAKEPLWLITTGAIINAFTMIFIALLTMIMNKKLLPKEYRPGLLTTSLLGLSALFYIFLLVVNFL